MNGFESYGFPDGKRYNSFVGYFKRKYGERLQKIVLDAGFTCPNRDGKAGRGGCTYCDNAAFHPSYSTAGKSLHQQLDEGIEFHKVRYRTTEHYLAYFQSFSNTYAPLEVLRERYSEALSHPEVVGAVIGTRPDCVSEEILDYFAELALEHYITIEYGIESSYDSTLQAINRGHDFACAERAVRMTAERGLAVGAHFVLGLPGETDEMILEQVQRINALPLTTIKFHQLQVFRGTAMEREYDEHPERFRFWELEEYLDLFIEILRRLRPDIVVERFASEAPPRYHYGRNWGLVRNETLWNMLEKRLNERNAWQGELYY